MSNLPQKPDEVTFKLLVRCRLMLSHALGHYEGGSELDGMIAVQGFDNSIEYLLRTIVFHLDIEQRTGKSFDIPELTNLAGSINKFLDDEYAIKLPYIGELKIFRQVRNLVQHGVVNPKPELNRIKSVTEKFYSHVLTKIFGISISEIQTSFLIDHPVIKSHLLLAEQNLEKGSWLECVTNCRDAFENAYYNEINRSDITISLMPAVVQSSEKLGGTEWSFLKIIEELENSRLGIDKYSNQKFQDYLDHIPTPTGHVVMQRDWEKSDALFCYEFVANSILNWQVKRQSPIYEIEYDSETNYVLEFLNNEQISREFEGECSYMYDDVQMALWYLPENQKEQIKELKLDKLYNFRREVYSNGKFDGKYEAKIKLTGKHYSLITHEPQRWQVIISYIVEEELGIKK